MGVCAPFGLVAVDSEPLSSVSPAQAASACQRASARGRGGTINLCVTFRGGPTVAAGAARQLAPKLSLQQQQQQQQQLVQQQQQQQLVQQQQQQQQLVQQLQLVQLMPTLAEVPRLLAQAPRAPPPRQRTLAEAEAAQAQASRAKLSPSWFIL